MCRQSTDFHFPGIDMQLQEIKEYGKLANQGRKEKLSMLSPNSRREDSRLSNSESPSHASENGMHVPTVYLAGTSLCIQHDQFNYTGRSLSHICKVTDTLSVCLSRLWMSRLRESN